MTCNGSFTVVNVVTLLCSDVAVINNGEILFQGALDEMSQPQQTFLYLRTDDGSNIMKLLENCNMPFEIDKSDLFKLLFKYDKDTIAVVKLMVDHGVGVCLVEKKQNTLEDLFIDVINH